MKFWPIPNATYDQGLHYSLLIQQTYMYKQVLNWICFNLKTSKYPKVSYIKVSDKMAYANSADPDQTGPSGSILIAIPRSIFRNKCIKSKISAKKVWNKVLKIFRTFTVSWKPENLALGIFIVNCMIQQGHSKTNNMAFTNSNHSSE